MRRKQTITELTIARLTFINSFVQRFNFVDDVGVGISGFGGLNTKKDNFIKINVIL